MEAGVRSLWARVAGAGPRALPLAGALLRGCVPGAARAQLLAALEAVPDHELQEPGTRWALLINNHHHHLYKCQFWSQAFPYERADWELHTCRRIG